MTCKRCEDIHLAQKNGTTQEGCKCSCHNETTNTLWYNDSNGTMTVPCTTATTSTFDLTNDGAFTFNGGAENFSLVGNYGDGVETHNGNCSCITSSEQCDDCKNAVTPAYPCTCTFAHTHKGKCEFCKEHGVP